MDRYEDQMKEALPRLESYTWLTQILSAMKQMWYRDLEILNSKEA